MSVKSGGGSHLTLDRKYEKSAKIAGLGLQSEDICDKIAEG